MNGTPGSTAQPGPDRGVPTANDPVPPGRLATMHPACFGMVMATGIVSLAAHVLGNPGMTPGDTIHPATGAGESIFRWIASVLLIANLAFYLILWTLTFVRMIRYRQRVFADLLHHGRGVGFFTTVAATCVLGSQVLIVGGPMFGEGRGLAGMIALWLWVLGLALWAVLTYVIFTALTVKPEKPTLAEGINGSWLLAVVAAQSVSALAAQLVAASVAWAGGNEGLVFVSLVMWLGGGMMYVWIISLIFYRYTFFPFKPSDLAPPYWINMGAMAISTLSGSMLLLIEDEVGGPLIRDLDPFIKGATLLFWATATWWIPMLIILGIWRHIYMKFPLRYDPLYWGVVFPLGMYSVATTRMTEAIDLPLPRLLPLIFFCVAFGAWALTLLGLLFRLVGGDSPAPHGRLRRTR